MRQAPTALMFRRNKNLSGTKCRVPAEASKGNTGIAFAALGLVLAPSASMVPCSREARKDIHAGLDESRTSRADSQFRS